MPLLICRTCPRDQPDSGAFGPQLDDALAASGTEDGVRRRHVTCVGGCLTPGNVALDSLGKARVRFSGLDASDAQALLQAARAYEASDTGNPTEWDVPPDLADRLTSVSLKGATTDDNAWTGARAL